MDKNDMESKFNYYHKSIENDFTSTLNEMVSDFRSDLNYQDSVYTNLKKGQKKPDHVNKNHLKIDNRDFKNNYLHTYYCIEGPRNFIYSNESISEIVGLSNMINHKVIKVRQKKYINEKFMSLISIDDEEIGWIELKSSVRAYRLPNIQGKCLLNGRSSLEASDIHDRIVKAKYIFFMDGETFLLVSKLGEEGLFSVKVDDFYRIFTPRKKTSIELKKGTPLYKDSRLVQVTNKVVETDDYRVVSFFEGLKETRVSVSGKLYWTDVNVEQQYEGGFSDEENDYEFIDYIVYLEEQNKKDKKAIEKLQNRLLKYESALEIDFND